MKLRPCQIGVYVVLSRNSDSKTFKSRITLTVAICNAWLVSDIGCAINASRVLVDARSRAHTDYYTTSNR